MALLVMAAFVLLPLLRLLVLAFDDGASSARILTWRWLPRVAGVEGWLTALRAPAQNQPFASFLLNSLALSIGSTLLCLGLGGALAYAFARLRFPGRRAGLLLILAGALLPPVALMVPFYLLLTQLGIRGSLWGLGLAYIGFGLPLTVWNMRAAFQAVPAELDEAAFLDGCSRLGAFMRIDLPIAMPSLIVAGLITFLAAYTEFAMGWLLLNDPERMTLAMALRNMSGFFGTAWNILAAFALLMCVPTVAIFILIRRRVDGVTG